jgi:hypothetical protein
VSATVSASAMFEASHPVLLFDYFRVPYRRVDADAGDAIGWLRRQDDDGGAIHWLTVPDRPDPAFHRIGGITVYGTVTRDAELQGKLADLGGEWRAGEPILDAAGERVAAVWRDGSGRILLPFDPAELITSMWSEAYAGPGGRRGIAMETYYRLRPLLPRRAQLALRRAYSRRQARRTFPRWPLETALHDLYDLLLGLSAEVAGEPVPYIAPWPNERRWALVLTHDVETEVGYRNIDLLRAEEEAAGYRSSWNFVPMRYRVEMDVVQDLVAGGFEVGVHGLYHDGRDLASAEILAERLPAMQEHARRWKAVGFRSPATHRKWELMPTLGFDYDSSYPDTDPFEPQSGGCCTWLPYFNRDLVELPITLPQDHTLFAILRREDERAWVEKASAIRERGGMALLITHPDYMLERRFRDIYARLLASFRDDPTVWRVLPGEVSAWWRRRADSRIVATIDGWRVEGPAAAEATVSLVYPHPRARRPQRDTVLTAQGAP